MPCWRRKRRCPARGGVHAGVPRQCAFAAMSAVLALEEGRGKRATHTPRVLERDDYNVNETTHAVTGRGGSFGPPPLECALCFRTTAVDRGLTPSGTHKKICRFLPPQVAGYFLISR